MRFTPALFLLLGLFLAAAQATVYFSEEFDDSWTSRWTYSKSKEAEGTAGKFAHASGKWHGNDKKAAHGIQTSQDARFYQISAPIPSKPVSNVGKDLVLQFTIKHEQQLDCGGGYIKVLKTPLDQEKFNGDSDYSIMFGPDICGTGTRRIHLIFNYKGKNLLWKKDVKCETDQLTHEYRVVVHPDNTYSVSVDGEQRASGKLEEDWDFLPPKTIPDPSAHKPADWVDEAEIVDPEDRKPVGWDDEPQFIQDPNASKPEGWDDEEDGEWEAPKIANPKHKGEWKPRRIPNPAYKGVWKAPEIPNPDYKPDNELYVQKDMGYMGIEIWQVKAGTIFDNFFLGDSVAEADEFSSRTFKSLKEDEKKMFDKAEEEKRAKEEEERKKFEEDRKKREEEEDRRKKAAEEDDGDDFDNEKDEL